MAKYCNDCIFAHTIKPFYSHTRHTLHYICYYICTNTRYAIAFGLPCIYFQVSNYILVVACSLAGNYHNSSERYKLRTNVCTTQYIIAQCMQYFIGAHFSLWFLWPFAVSKQKLWTFQRTTDAQYNNFFF